MLWLLKVCMYNLLYSHVVCYTPTLCAIRCITLKIIVSWSMGLLTILWTVESEKTFLPVKDYHNGRSAASVVNLDYKN